MSPPKLLLLNTIGLTGVELLLTELARWPGVLALPGQNFSIFRHNLYRPHEFTGFTAGEVFDSLARELHTREGRTWMGLTKHMTDAERAAYPAAEHRELFVARVGESRDVITALESFIVTFHAACGAPVEQAQYLTWFSNNVLLCHSHYQDFAARVKVVHVSCRIDRWLTMISQTRTWDCVAACRFYLLNSLFAAHYQAQNADCLTIYSDDVADRPAEVLPRIAEFLGVSLPGADAAAPVPGFIKRNDAWIAAQQASAKELHAIYKDLGWYQLAATFEQWSPEFLARPRTRELLDKFARFWNTTSHTNFDWIGPVGDELMDDLVECYPRRNVRNFNFTFYHEYFTLHSDSHDRTTARLDHFLGCLEDEIIIPRLPYFLKVCMEYLISAARNNIKLRHSYIPLRSGSVYTRLASPEYQAKIPQFGLAAKMAEMEALITEADTVCVPS